MSPEEKVKMCVVMTCVLIVIVTGILVLSLQYNVYLLSIANEYSGFTIKSYSARTTVLIVSVSIQWLCIIINVFRFNIVLIVLDSVFIVLMSDLPAFSLLMIIFIGIIELYILINFKYLSNKTKRKIT